MLPRRIFFRGFGENGDFAKIVLPLWWEHNFGGSDLPKIGPESGSERHRREQSTKIASGAVSGRTFSLPGLFFVDFRVPAGSQNQPKTAPEAWDRLFFDDTFPIFLRFLRSGVFRKAPGAILEAPGTLPDQILIGFCDTFLLVKAGSCRGLSGSAGMLPGSAPNLSNPLCGVPLGYGDLAQRFKFAVPRRGAGVLDSSGLLTGLPESLPLLTSPPDPRRPSIRTRATDTRAFFRIFLVFFGEFFEDVGL